MIFNWTVQTLSQICIQYATKRHFSTLVLEERLQMWLNCTATFVLLEIMVSCLHKIVHKNQDSCIKCLLNASLMAAPYFNWVLAHVCCVFPSVLPYKLLHHASEAFSKQSRKIDMIMDTLLSIFDIIRVQKEEHINDALFKLYTDSLSTKKDDEILCAVPFLLQICNRSPKLLTPFIVCKVLQSLTHSNLNIFNAQSLRRDDVLQRRALSRIVDCIKDVEQSGHKILEFLIKYACEEDKELKDDNSLLSSSAKIYCSFILEFLFMSFTNKTNIFLHYNKSDMKDSGVPKKSLFLSDLNGNTKQLCQQMLISTGIKKNIIQETLKLIALQVGIPKMTEVLTYILINSSLEQSYSCFMHFIHAFEVYEPHVVKESLFNAFTMMTSGETASFSQVRLFIKNLLKLEKEGKSTIVQNTYMTTLIKPYVKDIAQLTAISSDKTDISPVALELLQRLSMPDVLIGEYAIVVQITLGFYFRTIKQLLVPDINEYWSKLKICNDLLMKIIGQYMGIQQFIIRLLVEGIIEKKDEQFSTEPEKPLISVELVKQNLMMVQGKWTKFDI